MQEEIFHHDDYYLHEDSQHEESSDGHESEHLSPHQQNHNLMQDASFCRDNYYSHQDYPDEAEPSYNSHAPKQLLPPRGALLTMKILVRALKGKRKR